MAKILNKFTAFITALSILFTACFTGVIYSVAEETPIVTDTSSDSIVDGLTDVATVSKQIDTSTVSYKTVTNLAGGGVNVNFTQFSGFAPYRYSTNLGAFPSDGIRLCFDNYTINEVNTQAQGYGQLVVVLSYATTNSQSKIKKDVPFLQLDTVNGQLLLRHCNDDGFGTYNGFTTDATVIPANKNLKYDNLKQKQFDIIITKTNTGNYMVSVVLGSTEVNGIIEKTVFEKFSKRPITNTYISIGGLDNDGNSTNAWSIDFYGYEALSEKTYPCDIDKQLVENLTVVATKSDDIIESDYKRNYNIDGGGVKIKFENNAATQPYAFSKNLGRFAANGITLQFSGYENTETDVTASGFGQIAIILSSSTAGNMSTIKDDVPFLQIDTVNGKLMLSHYAEGNLVTDSILIENEALLYSNFSNKAFSIKISDREDKDYDVCLTVGDTVLSAVMSYDMFNAIEWHPTKLSTYVSVGSVGDAASFSVNFYGYMLEPSRLADGLTGVAKAEQDIAPAPTYKYLTNLDGGGVKIKFDRLSGYEPYQYPVNMGSFFTDKLTLQFSNYKCENVDTSIYGHGQLLIFLSNSTVKNRNKLKIGVPVILIDTVRGELSLASAKDNSFSGCNIEQTIISSDALKYDNFASRDFSISFVPYNYNIKVILTVDGEQLEGELDVNVFNSMEHHPTYTNTYVSIGGLDNNANNYNTWSVEFYGYKLDRSELQLQIAESATKVISDINLLPDDIALDDASSVLLAKASYDALSQHEKDTVINASKLESAYLTLCALQDAAMYKPTSTYYADYPAYDGQFPNNNFRTAYSVETEKGFLMEFKRPTGIDNFEYLRSNTLTGKYSLDGLTLLLENYSYTGESDFYVSFTSGEINDLWDGSADAAMRQIVLGFGQDIPSLWISGLGYMSPVSIGDNSAFVRENLVGKKIKIEWHGDSSGYNLFITIGEQVIGYFLDNSVFANGFDFNKDNLRVIISSAGFANEFKLECNGVYAKTSDNIQKVINLIEALPDTVTFDDKVTVDTAYVEYLGLSVNERQFVINYPKLNCARNKVRSLYGLDDEGVDEFGYYVPTLEDIAENSPNFKEAVSTESAQNGGLHIDFNNAVYGQRQYITERFVIENITLRFDNLQYANGGLMVGFTSQAKDGGIWNLLGATGRFGFYLLIGKDSSVYINYPYVDKKLFKIMESPLLSIDNLLNKEFFVNVRFTPGETIATNNITISLTIDGTTITKNLDELARNPVTGAYVYAHSMDQFKYDSAQLIIQSASDYDVETGNVESKKNNFSVDLTGIKATSISSAQQEEVDTVIAAIDALPDTASLEYEQQIGDVWNQYFELTLTKCRQAVTNYEKLLRLHDGLFALKSGNKVYYYTDKDVASVGKIDNTDILPKYIPNSQVELDSEGWPVWTKDIVMTEIRVKTCSPDGTFLGMKPVLQHLAETGVNCIWLSPTMDHGTDNLSDYCHYGPHTICPYLTGQIPYGEPYDPSRVDYAAGYQVFKEFVDLAHSYGIYILIDRNSWGLANSAPTIVEHPEWFRGDSSWGGQDFITQADVNKGNAKQEDLDALYEWFISTTVEFMLTSGADGIHWGLEPDYFGYNTIVKETLNRLRAAGTHPVFFSEASNSRQGVFAFEQFGGVRGNGVTSQLVSDVFFKDINIVEAIKSGKNIADGRVPSQVQHNSYGTAKYYLYQMSSHDIYGYRNTSHASWVYQFMFGSFMPLYYIGEEWNSSAKYNEGLYGLKIKWEERENPENQKYFESVKKLMRLRWQYKDIVNSDVDNHRDTNICTVDVLGTDLVQGYARYKDNQSIIVIPNVNERSKDDKLMTFNICLDDMNMKGYKHYTLTDMLTGDMILSVDAEKIGDVLTVSENIEYNTAGIYLLSGNDESFSWNIDESGILTINGNGTITSAPWLAADTTTKAVVIGDGITSLPVNAFAGFTGVEYISVPASLEVLPDLTNCSKDLTVCGVQGSAILAAAKAAGYKVLYSKLVDSTYGITVEYPAGTFFAEGTTLTATKLVTPSNMFDGTDAYTLTVKLNSATVTLAKEAKVTIPFAVGKSAYVYCVANGLATDKIDATITTDGVCFSVTELGSYAVSNVIKDFDGNFDIKQVVISVSGSTKTIKVFVGADYLKSLTDLAISFTENGSTTMVTDYTVLGDSLVFSYTTESDESVFIDAFIGAVEILSDELTINLSIFTEDGAHYVIYDTLPIGDANLDGIIDIKDIVRIKKMLANLLPDNASADVSGDGFVTSMDLAGLAKLLVSGEKGIKVYEVKFVGLGGKIIDMQYVLENFSAKSIYSDAALGMGFKGWDTDTITVTSDLTVTALYDNVLVGTVPEDWIYDE